MRLIYVAGMHRSGSSATTRVLNLLGMDLGPEEGLLPPGPDNPAGYWEVAEAMRVNNQVLEGLGGSWDRPPVLQDDWASMPGLASWRARIAALVDRLGSRTDGALGLKDPRLSLLLPLWESVKPADRVVVPIRHPSAVAQSLSRRNGFTPERSAYLWMRYLTSVFHHAHDPVIVDYGALLRNPAETAVYLSRAVGLPEPSDHDQARVCNFLDSQLDHGDSLEPPTSPALKLAGHAYESLIADPAEGVAALRGMWQVLVEVTADFRTDAEAMDQCLNSLERATELTRTLQGVQQRNRSLSDAVEALTEERDARSRELERTHSDARIDRAFHQSRITRLRHDVEQLSRQLENEVDQLKQARERLNARHAAMKSLRGQVREQKKKLRRERAARKAVEAELRNLEGRRAVRMALVTARPARPLFAVGRSLRARRRRIATSSPGGAEADRPHDTAPREIVVQLSADDLPRGPSRPSTPPRPFAEMLARHAVDPVTVIVPVFNAPEETRACVTSVLENTRYPYHLLLINDASTDTTIAPLLSEVAELPQVTVLTNSENLGFTATVNRGLTHCSGDVVLLNSDAVVGPMWLRTLAMTAYETDERGTVTAVSNNAGAFSVPERGADNPIPAHTTFDDLARRFAQHDEAVNPDTPTGNGFCMFIRRAVIDDIGLLDVENFPRGYGEENDFSMRARAAGWKSVVSDRALVFHAGSKSFGDEKQSLIDAGVAKVRELHPEYGSLVPTFLHGEPMERVRATARTMFRDRDSVRLRVLHLSHAGSGGVPRFVEDLTVASADSIDSYVLTSSGSTLDLARMTADGPRPVERIELDRPVEFGDVEHPEYADYLVRWVFEHGIEAAHLQHLIGHPLEAPSVLAAMGVPSVATLHDYYLACPTIQLLDGDRSFCGGKCTDGEKDCPTYYHWIGKRTPRPLKHDWVHEWRRLVSRHVLPHASAFVAPSEATLQVVTDTFAEITDRTVVVPHATTNRNVPTPIVLAEPGEPRPDRPLRCLALGNLNEQKGLAVLAGAMELDTEGEMELHILGEVTPAFRHLGIQHGGYDVSQVAEKIHTIGPDVVIIPSLWGETFCYTMSEAWLAGVPTVVSDLGALQERVNSSGCGWTFPAGDPAALHATLRSLRHYGAEWEPVRAALSQFRGTPGSAMAEEYVSLYKSALTKSPADRFKVGT